MSFIRIMAVLFGLAFLAAGIAGFMPMFVTDGNLLGLFEVNTMHNSVHLASGAVALLCSFHAKAAKAYFIIFGLVYGVVAVLGYVNAGNLMVMHMNMADNMLHAGIAVVSLLLGFFF
ncbi:MAG TPA: DUF4383 domain-containing protein [Gammaproteobacteria bacterium]|nr:DUF4383 domain-containing protein [Gammaproteobacteria bacterium]